MTWPLALAFISGWLTCCGVLYARGWWADRNAMKKVDTILDEVEEALGVLERRDARDAETLGAYIARTCDCDRCSGRRARA